KDFPLPVGAPFVTLIFSRVISPTKSPHFKPEFRKDILLSQMRDQTNEYIEKISSVLGNPRILAEFEEKVKKANKPMSSKVLASARAKGWRDLLHNLLMLIIYVGLIGLISLHMYWDKIKHLFNNIT
ncbi:MAG: hypothetical protein ISS66_21805, partial [Desulfobacteraceae bacterium]|nr:hypothetical protein [Desulfobacteraceae bacterium]